ncbi:hypothetical protein GLYMA_18G284550v4 [Glycine max]|nr:hypothetical protein GLYMA_18G284550v4 [Glycine max]KAH1156574.1 hypothetical protein GYH30_051391 [Glycine max]
MKECLDLGMTLSFFGLCHAGTSIFHCCFDLIQVVVSKASCSLTHGGSVVQVQNSHESFLLTASTP